MHSNEIVLVRPDGTLTSVGLKVWVDPKLTEAQREALREQALRQEVYGTKEVTMR